MGEISVFGQPTTMTEVMGIASGIVGVWLTTRRNILCFPVGILNVIIYAYLFFSPGIRLYADGLLQCIYAGMLIYGWINWKKEEKTDNKVYRMPASDLLKLSFITFVSALILGLFFKKYTDASLPWLDSALTIISLAAQWMIAKKYIENWILWMFVNTIYVPMYLYKQLPLTSALYAVFLLLAIKGFIDWKKALPTSETK